LTVWIEQGPHAILAGVIRGTAPPDLREVFQETLERIHLQFGNDMREFDGDASRFSATEPLLEECLRSGYDPAKQASPNRKITPLRVIAVLVLAGLFVWAFFWIRDLRRWNAYLNNLRNEPGILLTDSGKQGGKYFVSGLRDPLSRDPARLTLNTGLDSNSVVGHWQEFQSLTPDFIVARARKLLNAPGTVKLGFSDGVLEAEGFARNEWVEETRRNARFVPGVTQFKDDKVLELNRIENPLLMFDLDKTELRQDQEEKIDSLIADLNRLRSLSGNRNVTLEVTGRADRQGSAIRNEELSRGRADAVAALLKGRLADWTNLTIRTEGSKDQLREELTEEDRATNRSVKLKVTVQ
jgi:OOP family OmpA-OmpF porin